MAAATQVEVGVCRRFDKNSAALGPQAEADGGAGVAEQGGVS